MITKSRGNATHDTVCGCEDGYYLERGSCVRNAYCQPGEGIVDNGQRCESCPNGTYSDKLSAVEPCLPWKNCGEDGDGVAIEGTQFSDRVCVGQTEEESTSATHFTTVPTRKTVPEDTTAAIHVVKIIIQPTANTLVVVVLPVVSTVVGLLTCVGIYTLVIRKGCKHYWNKRLDQYQMQNPDHTAEDAILVQEDTNAAEDMQSPVECEEDSIGTNPKQKEVSSINQADGERLLPFVGSHITLPTPLPSHLTQLSVMDNPAYVSSTDEHDGRENKVPVAEESSRAEQSIPRDIPPMSQENLAVSPVTSTIASSIQTSESSLAYRQEGVDLVLGVYGKELTRRQLEQLAAEIGQDWPYLAQRLGLKQYQVDHTLNGYKADIQEQVYAMLQNWQQQKTGNATIADLNAALLECNRGELCRRLLSLSEEKN
ncbi:TNFRSF11B [Branchiostoma lanceolatum]|uniref:TNFRSF11B protein n=1 Tax=Branchiostoma lanceolatum TaxID=7740 RepID=A0A8K0EJ75_BRALA|nr:TNFRSF11B [Branchiostoma lanceolatum]